MKTKTVLTPFILVLLAACQCGDPGSNGDGGIGDGGASDGGGGGGAWQAPVALGDPATDEWDPQVATDATGNAVAVWVREYDDLDPAVAGPHVIRAIFDVATGAWSSADVISTAPDAIEPRVAMAPTGEAIVVWRQEGVGSSGNSVRHLMGTVLDGTWTPPARIGSENGSRDAQVVMAANGEALVLFVERDLLALRHTGGSWEASPTPLPLDQNQGVWEPRLGLDGNGDAHAIWRFVDMSSEQRVEASIMRNGSWDSPVTLAPASATFDPYTQLRLAVGAGGHALVTWVASFGSSRAEASTFRPGTGWSAVANLGEAAAIPGQDERPDVAIDALGDGWVVWSAGVSALDSEVRGSRLAGGSFGPTETLVTASGIVAPRVALRPDGTGFLIYGSADLEFLLRGRPFAGSFGLEEDLGDLAFTARFPPALVVDGRGGAVAVYLARADTPLDNMVRAIRFR